MTNSKPVKHPRIFHIYQKATLCEMLSFDLQKAMKAADTAATKETAHNLNKEISELRRMIERM